MTMVAGTSYPVGRTVTPRDSISGIIPPPGMGFGLSGPFVFDATSARSVPAVARCLQLYAGLCKQMPIDVYRGYTRVAPTPRLAVRPDPNRGGPWIVQVAIEDYLLNGNAILLTTVRGADGWPLAVQWLPASWVYIQWNTYAAETDVSYWYLGRQLPFDDVIHVRRGADRFYPIRGVGIVEEAMGTLDRVAMEEAYESSTLTMSAVPSVAIITPQSTLNQDVADQAKADWMTKFGGPNREPVILPNGTIVQPLAWSPSDTQLIEARRMSLTDVANLFNLDGYWLGSAVQGMTYRTAQPQYQQILRTSLEPVLADFEDVWSDAWFPRGTSIRFRRSQLLREDLATSTTAAVAAYAAGITTLAEARVEIGLPPDAVGQIGTGADQIASPEDPNAPVPGVNPEGGTAAS